MTQTCRGDCIGRRKFLRICLASGTSTLLSRPLFAAGFVARPIGIGVLQSDGPASARSVSMLRGFELGTEEASRASALFARRFQISRDTYASRTAIAASVTRLKSKGAQVIVGGATDDDALAIAAACDDAHVAFMNAGSTSDELRRSSCGPFIFHVEASNAMYASARGLSRSDDVLLWHPSLTRYGAAQLNDRFRARFGAGMDGSAWAAWMAVKSGWEAGLRASGDDSAAIAAELAAETSQFDGHKGAPLSFRTWDHQLRQPLYAVTHTSGGETEIADVPDIARSPEPARPLLDTLGDRASDHPCIGALR